MKLSIYETYGLWWLKVLLVVFFFFFFEGALCFLSETEFQGSKNSYFQLVAPLKFHPFIIFLCPFLTMLACTNSAITLSQYF